ncbi:MAG: hypothetical protein RIR65_1569 [Planctomycetota bacterium]
MTMNATFLSSSLPLVAVVCGLAPFAGAQTLFSQSGQIIAANGNQVPGLPAGVIYGGTSTFGNAVIDDAGNVCFRGRIQDPGLVLTPPLGATNDRALFVGPSSAGLALAYRAGDAAPLIPGAVLATATVGGLSGSPRLAPNGAIFFGATISGAGVTTANDTLIYAGTVGNVQILVREGDAAPSGGATMTGTFGSSVSYQGVGMNRNNRYVFKTSLTGGDVSGTTNNDGVVTGTLGLLPEWVVRKGDAGPAGTVISATGGFLQQMNDAGQIIHDVTLSTTLGASPATTANDKVLYIYTPGLGNTQILREGDPAPGTAGATFNNASNTWSFSVSASGFNGNGQFSLTAELLGGDVSGTTNDRALYIGSSSGLQLLAREGDPAPGTDGTFNVWNNTNSGGLTNSGRALIVGTITGGTTTTANNSGIWAGTPGNLQLAVREGDILPGTTATQMVGSTGTDNGFGPVTVLHNDNGSIYFQTDLIGPDVIPGTNDTAYCVWNPGYGVRVIVRRGDAYDIAPGVTKFVTTVGTVQFNNTDSTPLCWAPSGSMALTFNNSDGTAAVVKVDVPSTPGAGFCFGDGSATACPCGNFGAAGRGCASSVNANGALLDATGQASLASDSVVLRGTGMPNSSALYFQGTTQLSSGAGSVFGDGLRCAGGSVIRLGTRVNASGASQYPQSGDASVSVRGGVATPGTRTYQVWYRNAAAFCTSDTFNLTNGWQLTWGL